MRGWVGVQNRFSGKMAVSLTLQAFAKKLI